MAKWSRFANAEWTNWRLAKRNMNFHKKSSPVTDAPAQISQQLWVTYYGWFHSIFDWAASLSFMWIHCSFLVLWWLLLVPVFILNFPRPRTNSSIPAHIHTIESGAKFRYDVSVSHSFTFLAGKLLCRWTGLNVCSKEIKPQVSYQSVLFSFGFHCAVCSKLILWDCAPTNNIMWIGNGKHIGLFIK